MISQRRGNAVLDAATGDGCCIWTRSEVVDPAGAVRIRELVDGGRRGGERHRGDAGELLQ